MPLTSIKKILSNSSGFSILDILIAFAIVTTLTLTAIGYFYSQNRMIYKTTAGVSRDRIVKGVRSVAGNPAALRNSMRAVSDSGMVNPKLLACIGGNPANSCTSSEVYGLTLYSPVVAMDSTGDIVGIQAITSPPGSTTPARFDLRGMPCQNETPERCPIIVSTTFNAQCAPPALTPAQLSLGALAVTQLAPQDTCTVADTVTVAYSIQLDPAVAALYLDLASIAAPLTGSVTTSVQSISRNMPQ